MKKRYPAAHITIHVIIIILLCTCTFAKSPNNDPPARKNPKPNIIFLLADDMRWDAMSCVGNKIIKTPNLDRLADRGVLFTNNFCTTSICAVSRAGFITGQYASRHNIRGFSTPLAPQQFDNSYLGLLRSNGYRTGFVGKWGLGGPLPKERFDFWAGYSGQGNYFDKGNPQHLTARLCKKALQFITDSAHRQPFHLSVSFKAPHVQDRLKRFIPDPKYQNLFENVTVPVFKTANEKAFQAKPEFIQKSMNRKRWKWRFATPRMYQDTIKDYYRLIAGVDDTVGQIRNLLAELRIEKNTIIIFSSDNGFFLGEHGLAGKWLMYE